MSINLIQKIIYKYFQDKKLTKPEKITPFIYSGENSTIVFIYLNNEKSPDLLLKIKKGQEHSFFKNELVTLKLLHRDNLKHFIPTILKNEPYSGVEYFLTKFYQPENISKKILNSENYSSKMIKFFNSLHQQKPGKETITNTFYQHAIDCTHELLKAHRNSIEIKQASKACFSYLHHGDLTIQNILWTKNNVNPIIVDWEYASKGWPFYDLLHYYFHLNNIFDSNSVIKKKNILKKINSIIDQINNDYFSRDQIDFFIFTSIYSYLLKYGTNSISLYEELRKIANSYFIE